MDRRILAFLIPGAVATGQLGRMFPGEAWFYLVAGLAVVSLLVAVGIYYIGKATSAGAAGAAETSVAQRN